MEGRIEQAGRCSLARPAHLFEDILEDGVPLGRGIRVLRQRGCREEVQAHLPKGSDKGLVQWERRRHGGMHCRGTMCCAGRICRAGPTFLGVEHVGGQRGGGNVLMGEGVRARSGRPIVTLSGASCPGTGWGSPGSLPFRSSHLVWFRVQAGRTGRRLAGRKWWVATPPDPTKGRSCGEITTQ